MKMFKSMRSLAVVFVFGILINWYCFSDDSYAAQAQKTPAATQQKSPVMNTQPPTPMNQRAKVIIEGRAMYGTRGMGGLEMTLTEYYNNGQVGIVGKKTTNKQGYYNFSTEFNNNVVKFKIVPKHPDFAPGVNFSPREIEFSPTSDTTKISFTYSGHLPDLVPTNVIFLAKTQGGSAIISVKNQGGSAAGSFKVKFYYTCGINCQLDSIPEPVSLKGLSAGESANIKAQAICFCLQLPEGFTRQADVIAVSVDYEDWVFESNEDNNVKDVESPNY